MTRRRDPGPPAAAAATPALSRRAFLAGPGGATLALAGCSLGTDQLFSAGGSGTKITVAIVSNSLMQDAISLSHLFEREHPGVRLNFVSLPENEARAKITADVSARGGGRARSGRQGCLYPSKTVGENMGFALKMHGVAKDERARRVREAAKLLDLEPLLDRKPRSLSGGQRQRVAAMNRFDGTPEPGGIRAAGVIIRAPDAQLRAAQVHDQLIVGIRPEHLSIGGGDLTLEVDLVEDLGSDSYVYGHLAGDAASNVIVRAARSFGVAVDATGAPAAIETAFGSLERGGRLLIFGVSSGDATVSLSPFRIYNDEITIAGSMAVLNSFGVAADLMAAGVIDTGPLLGSPYALDQFPEALAAARNGEGVKVQVRLGR